MTQTPRTSLIIAAIMVAVIVVGVIFLTRSTTPSQELILFHADSLALPFEQAARAFERAHPGVKVVTELSGSRVAARKVSELNRRCDILAAADYRVIDQLLRPAWADWNIRFAGNAMVVAYSERSRHQAEINADNWYKILAREDVSFGRSNPDQDPSGYRALMTWQLADRYYKTPDGQSPRINETLLACPPSRQKIRPNAQDLLPLLQSMGLDYAFLYRSVAMQHNLRFVDLPNEVNLGWADLADVYAQASVSVSGQTQGQTLLQRGAPIVYGLTIVKGAPNPAIAEQFVAFLLGPEGRKIFTANYQTPLDPPEADGYDALPARLKPLVAPVKGK